MFPVKCEDCIYLKDEYERKWVARKKKFESVLLGKICEKDGIKVPGIQFNLDRSCSSFKPLPECEKWYSEKRYRK